MHNLQHNNIYLKNNNNLNGSKGCHTLFFMTRIIQMSLRFRYRSKDFLKNLNRVILFIKEIVFMFRGQFHI